MNTYPEFSDFDELDRRSRTQGGMAMGDVIGSMISATLFGLTRSADDFGPGTGRSPAPEGEDIDSTRGGGDWR